MIIHNAAITGSLSLNGVDLSSITGSSGGSNFATTGSNIFIGNQTITGSVAITDNILIGSTTGSEYKLYVSGTIYATGDIIALSDSRVKTNIRPIDNVIERIINSRGVIYDRIDQDSLNNIGFIAQELEETFPELVSTDINKNKGVKYQNAVAILFEAIKEQQKQIENLKLLINNLI
jgi:hypothetical protein